MRKALCSLAVALLAAGPAGAYVIGGTNFGIGGYPEESCQKPDKPLRPYSPTSQWEIDSYNNSVRRYNDELDTYIRCVREYLDNAKLDVKRVQERMQEAVDKARRD